MSGHNFWSPSLIWSDISTAQCVLGFYLRCAAFIICCCFFSCSSASFFALSLVTPSTLMISDQFKGGNCVAQRNTHPANTWKMNHRFLPDFMLFLIKKMSDQQFFCSRNIRQTGWRDERMVKGDESRKNWRIGGMRVRLNRWTAGMKKEWQMRRMTEMSKIHQSPVAFHVYFIPQSQHSLDEVLHAVPVRVLELFHRLWGQVEEDHR